MNEELDQLLKNLKLRRILDIYEEQLRGAEKEDVSYTEFVTRSYRQRDDVEFLGGVCVVLVLEFVFFHIR